MRKSSIILLIVFLILSILSLNAQSDDLILTIGVYEGQQALLDEELFALYEAANPGIKIVRVVIPSNTRPPRKPVSSQENDIQAYLDSIQSYAELADILPVTAFEYNVHSTQSGAFLDLTPLIAADPDARLDDFYPPMLDSFRWNGGTWALPTASAVEVIIYDRLAFDEVGLPYPDESWSVQDYTSIGRLLTLYDANGQVSVPGMFGFDNRILLRAFLGHSLVDSLAFPPIPQLDDPDLIAILEEWIPFLNEMQLNLSTASGRANIPITFGNLRRLEANTTETPRYGAALLPGGEAALRVNGYAISAGTPYPEQAYAFLQWLTATPDVIAPLLGDRPARPSLLGDEAAQPGSFFRRRYSAETEQRIDEALTNALPATEYAYFDYVVDAIQQVLYEDVDLETAIRDAQQESIDILAALSANARANPIIVATPIPTPVLNPGEISLTFGIESRTFPLPNLDVWEQTIADFVAQDPEVRQITIETELKSLAGRAQTQDCFFMSSNPVPGADLSLLLPVDPFINVDPAYNPNDIVAGALDQVTRDGFTYGIPLAILPRMLGYDLRKIEELFLFEPFMDWTVSDFENFIRDYHRATGDAAYRGRSFDNTYMLLLIMAYGGQPIDYSTDPYTYNLTDPAFIQAAEQVLGLIEDGLIQYSGLGDIPDGLTFDGKVILYDARLQFNRALDAVVPFPATRQMTPMSYNLRTVHISPLSSHQEACYRWIRYFSNNPVLLSGMPARRSLIEAAANTLPDPEAGRAFYRNVDDLLQDPALMVIPDFESSSSTSQLINYVTETWMNLAFDTTIFDGGDLLNEMEQAQGFITNFQACSEGITRPTEPLWQLSDEAIDAYYNAYAQCAVDVDSRMASFLGLEE